MERHIPAEEQCFFRKAQAKITYHIKYFSHTVNIEKSIHLHDGGDLQWAVILRILSSSGTHWTKFRNDSLNLWVMRAENSLKFKFQNQCDSFCLGSISINTESIWTSSISLLANSKHSVNSSHEIFIQGQLILRHLHFYAHPTERYWRFSKLKLIHVLSSKALNTH